MTAYLAVLAALVLGVVVGTRFNRVRVQVMRRVWSRMRHQRDAARDRAADAVVRAEFAELRLCVAEQHLADVMAMFPAQTWHPEHDPRAVLSRQEADAWDAITEGLADEAAQWTESEQ